MLARYKKETNPNTLKALLAIDEIAKRLAAKDLKSKDRDALVNKLNDKFKKLKVLIKEDLKLRDQEWAGTIKKPPEGFNQQAATRTWQTVRREILTLQRKVSNFVERGGKEPPPPKMPDLHFGAQYKQLIVQSDATLSPSVVAALAKLDGNHDAAKVMELGKAARLAFEAQEKALTAEIGKSHDPKEKMHWSKLIKDLTAFRRRLEEFEDRIFLIHRLKG